MLTIIEVEVVGIVNAELFTLDEIKSHVYLSLEGNAQGLAELDEQVEIRRGKLIAIYRTTLN